MYIAHRELLHALFIPYVQECVFFWPLLCDSDKHRNMSWEVRGKDGGGVLTNLSVDFLIKTIFPWLMIEITIKSVFDNNNFN